MLSYLARRLSATLVVVAVVASLVFTIIRLAPGDPALAIAGDAASIEHIEQVRAQLGLDQPLAVQFGLWARHMLALDLGHSLYYHIPVSTLIGQRLPPTLLLAGLTLLISVPLALSLGALAAAHQGQRLDRLINASTVLGFSIPVFVVSYVLIWLVALQLGLLPVQGSGPEQASWWARLPWFILPAVGLAFGQVALLARITRAAVIDALAQDFVKTARAKGASARRVLWGHALPNAAVPIVTVIGLSLAALMGGVVVTETVYAIPGLGKLTVDAVLARDFPVIQGVVVFFSLSYVGINLLIDLSYLLLDPRIRY